MFVDPGTYPVSEAGANGTDLADYASAVACEKNGQPTPVPVTSATTTSSSARSRTRVSARSRSRSRPCPAATPRRSASPRMPRSADVPAIRRRRPGVRPRSAERRRRGLRGRRGRGAGLPARVDLLRPGRRLQRLSPDAHGEHPRVAGRDGALQVHQRQGRRADRGRQERHGARPPRRPPELHVRRQQPRQLAAARRRRSRTTAARPSRASAATRQLDPGEHWTYECSYTAPAHAAGEADPIVNTVTAAADEQDRPVSDTDDHSTDLLHPDIEIDKPGRQAVWAHVGDALFRLHVRRHERRRHAADGPVQPSDPRCDAGTLAGRRRRHARLGETWTSTCSHVVTAADPDPLPNTAKVTGTDELGGKDADDFGRDRQAEHPGGQGGQRVRLSGRHGDVHVRGDQHRQRAADDVAVTDDHCAPVTPALTNGDRRSLDSGENGCFTCSKQIAPGHRIGDENPIRNVGDGHRHGPARQDRSRDRRPLVEGAASGGRHREDRPGDGDGWATALAYTLTVTNPGDVPFAVAARSS